MSEIVLDNISRAWMEALRRANAAPNKEACNLMVTLKIVDGCISETEQVRESIDATLHAAGYSSVNTVANTIFPQSLFRPGRSASEGYEMYLRLWPKIQSNQANRFGTYFQRLIAYPKPGKEQFNQLDFVITTLRKGIRRRSALQCSILAPQYDLHATPLQGFPCMQQVAFSTFKDGSIGITGFYPLQYLWKKAYGNYLGLYRLGRFIARESGCNLKTVSCLALGAKSEDPAGARKLLSEQI